MGKLLFIEPKAPGLHIYSKFPIPRLGNVMLATMARERGWHSEVVIEEMTGFDTGDLPQADLVGISSITSTAPRAYEIADAYRRRGVPVIMGGPHVSFMPDEAIEHSDFVVQGEGELPFTDFLTEFEGEGKYENVSNLVYRDGDRIITNPTADALQDLSGIPPPDLNLVQGFDNQRRRMIVPIETSRGCPFNCEFCSVSILFGRRMRFHPIEQVIEELRLVQDSARMVFFVDDNFTANKARTKSLLQAMIDEGLRLNWSAQVRSDAAEDDELLGLMKRSGCMAVYIGIESINDETLKRVQKGQKVEEVSRSIDRFHSNGIRVHGMFILGFDEDNKASVRDTWRYAKRTHLNSVQFLVLTPVPGTPFFNKMRSNGRLLTEDWSLYDAHHVVFRPQRILPFDLQKLQIKAHEKFYSFMRRVKHLSSFKFFEFAIARYAGQINHEWKRVNHIFMKWLKRLSWKAKSE
jgi:radical SAM superfamily enzyme YgiQ (UPF0313 family)